jgi:hypothetical protein
MKKVLDKWPKMGYIPPSRFPAGGAPMRILPPVFPFRGLRDVDSWGSGAYGAPRDEGARSHLGLDFLGKPGDTVVASIGGRIGTLGFMYATSPKMRNIHIIGTGEYDHYSILVGYVEAASDIEPDTIIRVGEIIGLLQDVSAYWAEQKPKHAGTMKNHCHLGLKIDGTYVNPSKYLPGDLPTC